MAEIEYQKLCGRSLTSLQACYLSQEALVILDGRFKERIRRLKYEDIEATLIFPSRFGKVIGILSAIAGVFFLWGLVANRDNASLWFWLACNLLSWGYPAYIFYNKGTAMMGVQTAVQTVVLRSVTTLRKARRVEGMLAQRIEGVQGKLERETLRAAFDRQRELAYERRDLGNRAVPPTVKKVPQAPPPPRAPKEGPPPLRSAAMSDGAQGEPTER